MRQNASHVIPRMFDRWTQHVKICFVWAINGTQWQTALQHNIRIGLNFKKTPHRLPLPYGATFLRHRHLPLSRIHLISLPLLALLMLYNTTNFIRKRLSTWKFLLFNNFMFIVDCWCVCACMSLTINLQNVWLTTRSWVKYVWLWFLKGLCLLRNLIKI